MEQILINSSREEARVAILEDGILKDILVERMCARGLVGNVYYGQVVRVLPGMQSAFLNVGLERTAFLHIAEIEGARTETGALRPIETLLHEGQRLMVQVAKDPIGTRERGSRQRFRLPAGNSSTFPTTRTSASLSASMTKRFEKGSGKK